MNPYSPPALVAQQSSSYVPDPAYRGSVAQIASELTVEHLKQTRPWVVLISVVLFLGSGLMLVAGVGMVIAGLVSSGTGFPGWIGAIYLPFAALYIFPALKLWTYSSAISRLVTSRSLVDLEAALNEQRSFWKFCGIAFIVVVALYGLIFAGAMAFGLATAIRH